MKCGFPTCTKPASGLYCSRHWQLNHRRQDAWRRVAHAEPGSDLYLLVLRWQQDAARTRREYQLIGDIIMATPIGPMIDGSMPNFDSPNPGSWGNIQTYNVPAPGPSPLSPNVPMPTPPPGTPSPAPGPAPGPGLGS